MFFSDCERYGEGVAKKSRCSELDILAQVDRAGAGQLHRNGGTDQRAGQHAVSNAFAKGRAGSVFGVEMQRVVISRHCGKRLYLLVGDKTGIVSTMADFDFVKGQVADLQRRAPNVAALEVGEVDPTACYPHHT